MGPCEKHRVCFIVIHKHSPLHNLEITLISQSNTSQRAIGLEIWIVRLWYGYCVQSWLTATWVSILLNVLRFDSRGMIHDRCSKFISALLRTSIYRFSISGTARSVYRTRLLEEAADAYQTVTKMCAHTLQTPPSRECLEQSHAALESIITKLREIQLIFTLYVIQEGTRLARVASAVNAMVTRLLSALQQLNCHMDGLEEASVGQRKGSWTGRKGRPELSFRQDSLEALLALNFSWTTIADFYGRYSFYYIDWYYYSILGQCDVCHADF